MRGCCACVARMMLAWLLPRQQLLSDKSLLPPTANDVAVPARRRFARSMVFWGRVAILTGVPLTAFSRRRIRFAEQSIAGNSGIDFDGREC